MPHTSNGCVYQSRINPIAVLPPQTHLSKLTGYKIFYEYIRLGNEFMHYFQTFWLLQINGDRPLIPVNCKKIS
jgi:hypothetical protein